MKKFQKIKDGADGWPSDVVTDQDKRDYLDAYRQHENIDLRAEDVDENKGLRHCGKLVCELPSPLNVNLADSELDVGKILAEPAKKIA